MFGFLRCREHTQGGMPTRTYMIDRNEDVHATTNCTRTFVLDVICLNTLAGQLRLDSNGTLV